MFAYDNLGGYMNKIVLTGGGTAGHVYPSLAIKEELGDNYEYHYIGGNGMEKDIIAKEKDIIYHTIAPVKLVRKLTFKNLLIPIKLIKSILQAKKNLKKIKPNIVFSKGGFVAVPVVIASHMLKIPIISHESDLSMGLANKIILRYCDVMCVSFEQTTKLSKKCLYTGQPIRKKILNGNKNNLNLSTNFNNQKRNLLIVGGSSGAEFLNNLVAENFDNLCKNYNILHLCGKNNKNQLQNLNYKQIEYAQNMGDYLDWADIVLSRAGSGAINEFLALKKPMLLIPLSKKCSRGDQIENAHLFESLNIALVLEEEDYNKDVLLKKLDDLSKNISTYKNNMKKVSTENASKKIANLINSKLSKS